MWVKDLIEVLQMFPENMEVMVQTCENDLLQPIRNKHIWITEACIDGRYKNLEPSRLVITAFIKGDKVYQEKNKQSGVLIKYEPAPETANV